jgi:hypothetical protein
MWNRLLDSDGLSIGFAVVFLISVVALWRWAWGPEDRGEKQHDQEEP